MISLSSVSGKSNSTTSALAAACAAFLCGSAVHAQPNMEDVEGKWSGSVSVASSEVAQEFGVADELQIDVEILGEAMTIAITGSELWELGPGQITRLGASAVIFGPVLAADVADTWVVTLTKQDTDTVLAFLSRTFHSADPGGSGPVAIGAVGQLRRIVDE